MDECELNRLCAFSSTTTQYFYKSGLDMKYVKFLCRNICLGIWILDFNASLFRCEVKSLRIQIDAPFTLGGIWIDSSSRRRISQKIRQEFFDARNQVGRDGIIFITPLSSNLNALFRGYFKDRILYDVPPPQGGSVVLVLSTQTAFRDCYLSIPMVNFLIDIERAISGSYALGLRSFSIFTRWPFQLTTASAEGSTVQSSLRGN